VQVKQCVITATVHDFTFTTVQHNNVSKHSDQKNNRTKSWHTQPEKERTL